MDPYSQYKKQLEYYEYFEKQRENYTDLSQDQPNPNDSIVVFANLLFKKSLRNLNQDLSGILVDETMEAADIFCMLIELVLHGLHILTDGKSTIFDLEESTDDVVYTIKSYLKSAGFDIVVTEDFMDDDQPVCLYRDRNDYYCEIVPKPPAQFCQKDWYVLKYRMINNKKFKFMRITPITNFKAFFISNKNKIFTIHFKYINSKN
ncbi:mg424 protein [Tupanvirus deep ocean]|uniref:Mg424 protein n=2 Tax=Tupanvirus TaxID=2094720 RepID=A0AC62A924_9VIRU|nr:mg424 protein [Tupanvirus deep ocean]QKU34155.1 mg424 protein [Tupanvirus deep ocean]